MNKIMENENKGFSLVELIVVIAIMAVLTSVLAPSLLGYVEKSRMQKDDSAMGEVANAIKLALADQDVYDECLTYNLKDNFSCYIDSSKTTDITAPATGEYTVDKSRADSFDASKDDWHYNDNLRLKDEEAYKPAGRMRGMTITFRTSGGSNAAEFKLGDGLINAIPGPDSTNTTKAAASGTQKNATKGAFHANNLKLSGMDANCSGTTEVTPARAVLYNKLRAVIGDSIVLSSQTYRNSDYTVFIRMGSMGGNEAGAQDAVAVYGQWNGTNLDPHAVAGAAS